MPGYRLTFNTYDVNVTTVDDNVAGAIATLGDAAGTLASTVELLTNDYYADGSGFAQFAFRFAAADDAAAYEAAKATMNAVRLPADGIKLERRSRSYVPVREFYGRETVR